jgi:hypothetical protein
LTPKWNDPALKAGTKIRTALWLIAEVGLGNSFTKEQHRAAFPGISQADRRMRDLRKDRWVIHTSAEDVSLNSDEQRLVAVGDPIWERGRKRKKDFAITAKLRKAVLAQSDYQCSVCGIAGGEAYPDVPHTTAVLGVSTRTVTLPDGGVEKTLVAECKLCKSGHAEEAFNLPALIAEFEHLSDVDRSVILAWISKGRRSSLDRLWRQYRRLPEDLRKDVRQQITAKTG